MKRKITYPTTNQSTFAPSLNKYNILKNTQSSNSDEITAYNTKAYSIDKQLKSRTTNNNSVISLSPSIKDN